MMAEYNDIFLAGGGALMYLAEPIHQEHSTFVWNHPFSTCVSSYDQFFNIPSP